MTRVTVVRTYKEIGNRLAQAKKKKRTKKQKRASAQAAGIISWYKPRLCHSDGRNRCSRHN